MLLNSEHRRQQTLSIRTAKKRKNRWFQFETTRFPATSSTRVENNHYLPLAWRHILFCFYSNLPLTECSSIRLLMCRCADESQIFHFHHFDSDFIHEANEKYLKIKSQMLRNVDQLKHERTKERTDSVSIEIMYNRRHNGTALENTADGRTVLCIIKTIFNFVLSWSLFGSVDRRR